MPRPARRAEALCDELSGRDWRALADVHVNVSLHADKVEVKDSAEATGGKENRGRRA